LMAAATLIVVAKFLLPVFLENNIQTMPQFIEKRFDGSVRTGLAIFWVALFIFVNIASLFYLGSLAIERIVGIPMMYGVIGLLLYSAAFSIFGGLKAVVWSDVIQVVVLIFGGLIATYLVLAAVGDGSGVINGLKMLYEKAPEKFNMIFTKEDTYIETGTGSVKSSYELLPGLGVLIGGMWIANMYYWGFNQYIVQRALAAKDIRESQKGVLFAAFMKIFMPLIVVVPGIAAFVLGAELNKADEAYPWVISSYVGVGFKGIIVAAIIAAIGSSISSMVNSASTIYTLDIHHKLINTSLSESALVKTGKIAATLALIIGALVSPILKSQGQIFQYIQEYTGFISPGILVVFLLGLFWPRATTRGALVAVFLAIPLSLFLKSYLNEMAFLHRMGISFLILTAVMVGVSLLDNTVRKKISLPDGIFKTSTSFNFWSLILFALLAVFYAIFW
ncbi:MAG TPA: sodium/solute symporter, partial [Saprospiraceae bacterium]|nr:sodium/solute symporter [Saprospiraceae bacterium]